MSTQFLCYHRDRSGSLALRERLVERHWSYMDRYAHQLIARGPTLADDAETPTGSVHIVDLPGPDAARSFAFDEPYYQAGVYRDVLLRRWRNSLGRTMWDFVGDMSSNRYLVLGLGPRTAATPTTAGEPNGSSNGLIAHGPLLSDDGETWLGTAALVGAIDAETARSALAADQYAGVEVHRWDFGGRPSRARP